MDSDRVLVMDAGAAVEFDHPHDLLQNRNGHFYKMVEQTGRTTADSLRAAAAMVNRSAILTRRSPNREPPGGIYSKRNTQL